jgi:type I restriction enzyme S subunit
MVKTFQIQLSQLITDDQLRLDQKFACFAINQGWNVFEIYDKPLIRLKDILVPSCINFDYEEGEEYKGIPTGADYIDEDGEIINWQVVDSDNHPGRLKYKADRGNLLISSLKGAKVPAILIEKDLMETVFSNGFYVFKVKAQFTEKFLLYVLRSKKFCAILNEHIYRGIGISAYREKDFLNIRIPLISKDRQSKFIAEIEKIEQEIKKLKSKLRQPQEIINEVFAEEFRFDLKELEKARIEKIINTSLYEYSKNEDLRFGFRFHNAAGKTALKILKNFATKKIQDFLTEPIRLGAGISPTFYDDDNGEAYYLTMATIKNWCFETEGAKKVSENYWESEEENNSVRKNDIIIARSGEGTIGKVAIIESDEDKAIFCDFTMRIRLANYNSLFAYYYFRTELFQVLIESNKKGLGNNTNIFPSQIKEFPISDVSLNRQNKIVEKIKSQLDEQEQKKKTIDQKRQEIDKVIEDALRK